MGSLEEILAGYDGLQAGQEAFYKDLHRHPELSHQEHRTAERVEGKLQEHGCTVQTGIGGTGVVGVLANGAGPTVLLRAELDALPVKEDTGADYASTATAKDAQGHEVPVAHACGHDMHMSCLLGMVKLMSGHRDQWRGTLLPLFQPAEETGDGAQAMVDDGLLARGHGHRPAADHRVPRGRAGRDLSGDGRQCPGRTRSNLIPDHALLELNLRSYSEQAHQHMLASVQRIVRAESQASGSPRDPDFDTVGSFPLTVNEPATTDRVASAFAAHFGDTPVKSPGRRSARTSATFPTPPGCPTPTGRSGTPTRRPTAPRRRPGGCRT
jgi:metal-dependent amidase/aminoacylase/carboxypeptidase family protein